MNKEQLNNGIGELKNLVLSQAEKERMLKEIFSTSIPTPYFRPQNIFALFIHSPALAFVAVFALVSGGLSYASQNAMPGENLYTVKTQVVEPLVGSLNFTPEAKVSWEEQRVERRIGEAEKLAEMDRLDDEKAQVLEEKIVESSTAFAQAVEAVATQEPTEDKRREKAEELKRSFQEKFAERNDDDAVAASAATMMMATSAESGSTTQEDQGQVEMRAKTLRLEAEDTAVKEKLSDKKEKIRKLKEKAIKTVVESRNSKK